MGRDAHHLTWLPILAYGKMTALSRGESFCHSTNETLPGRLQREVLTGVAPVSRSQLFGSGMLVDVFFLGVVQAHKGLYRLDNALRIAN